VTFYVDSINGAPVPVPGGSMALPGLIRNNQDTGVVDVLVLQGEALKEGFNVPPVAFDFFEDYHHYQWLKLRSTSSVTPPKSTWV